MKKAFNRTISLILSLVMILMVFPVALAYEHDEAQTDSVIVAEQEYPEQPENEEEFPEQEAEPQEEEAVALLSVASRVNFDLGHAWLYIENLSDEPIQVGHYEVPVGEGVSVGLFVTRSDGLGIYYNVEAYSVGKYNNKGVFSLSKPLTRDELEKVSREIKGYLNYWGLYFNCTFFAYSIWNSVSTDFLIPLFFPIIGIIQMLFHGAKADTLEMYYPSEDEVFRQRGTGSDAYLEPVSEGSLSHSIA